MAASFRNSGFSWLFAFLLVFGAIGFSASASHAVPSYITSDLLGVTYAEYPDLQSSSLSVTWNPLSSTFEAQGNDINWLSLSLSASPTEINGPFSLSAMKHDSGDWTGTFTIGPDNAPYLLGTVTAFDYRVTGNPNIFEFLVVLTDGTIGRNIFGPVVHVNLAEVDSEYMADTHTVVPEPATLTLLSLGAVALLAPIRKRRKERG